jgi:murein DD-endopeptidase MepM/ murein hydrolase activator NlpD
MRLNNLPLPNLQSSTITDSQQINNDDKNLDTIQLNTALPEMNQDDQNDLNAVPRRAMLITNIPTRSRTEIITYTVKMGDTLFSISEQFKIEPSTLLWGNYEVLEDNPHLLKPGQELKVLPVNGTFYEWRDGDTLESIAGFFKAKPEDITSFTGNNIDLTLMDEPNSGIQPGTWIVIPGGKRALKDWGPPAITRSNPASASQYGPGHCGEVYSGAVGSQYFIWPTVERYLSGYKYDPNVHPAIDIAGQEGNAIFAADSGVVVYAGWSNFGYGYLIVIDHGAGWQTAYAHLSAVGVSCGESVLRGAVIGALGNTGNSTGAHLHFEMIFNGVKVNPMDFLN